MNTEMKIDAATVRRLRESRAWSQEQLAAVAGVSVRTIQRVEADGSGSCETCMGLANAFECVPADLMKASSPGIVDTAQAANRLVGQTHADARTDTWNFGRINAVICTLAVTIIVVGMVLGDLLIDSSTRIFGASLYAPLGWTIIFAWLVAAVTMPGAWRWAAKRRMAQANGFVFGQNASA
jgi:transcriptional regulator with XRE-family HTH domain